jgi:hypothetical protein
VDSKHRKKEGKGHFEKLKYSENFLNKNKN